MTDSVDTLQPIDKVTRPIEIFRSDLQNICGSFQVKPLNAHASVTSHLSVQQVAGLEFAQVGLDVDQVLRSRKDISIDPGDHFFLILQREGRSHMSQNRHNALIEPGDMFLVDSTQESQFRYDGNYSLQQSLHLPRNEMLHRFGNRISGGEFISKSDPIGLSMRALLAKLSADRGRPQGHVVEALYSVFGALLEERASQKEDCSNPDRRVIQRALALIAEHYRDPAFSTTQLAACCGISLHRLQRAFKLIGETPHNRLQAFRLTSARTALLSYSSADKRPSIATVAFQNGFSDLSTFYRLHRKAYGEPPGQLLEKAPTV